jgi:hypothetical protein
MKATLSEINTDTYYINATWRIDKDKLNYILQKKYNPKTDDPGKRETWRTQGYYPTVAQLYHALVEIGIRECSLMDMKGLMDRVEELHSLIENSASILRG